MRIAVAGVILAGIANAKLYERCPALEKKFVSLLSKLKNMKNPGVGADLEKVKAGMDKVYKDGFYHVACVNDGMRINADKHGDGKFKYAAQNIDVSIVWYNSLTPSEDREEMTHKVCYNFCRRVEGMNFFGIQNGRDCYCTPYYKQEVGAGSEDCDAPCDGNPAMMCGGKTKSDIFQMHWCGDVAKNLGAAVELVQAKKMDLSDAVSKLEICANSLQDAGEALQKQTADNGDSFSGDDGQNAKIVAGEYKKAIRSAQKAVDAADAAGKTGTTLQSGDETSPDNAMKAEAALEDLDLAAVHAEDALDEITSMSEKCEAVAVPKDNVLGEYFNVAKWTAKGFEEHSTTCNGEEIGAPSKRSPAECATYCDATVSPKKCVGFQSYGDTCVLFSSITDVAYYAEMDCATAEDATCQLKMSESVGFAPKNGVTKQGRCFY